MHRLKAAHDTQTGAAPILGVVAIDNNGGAAQAVPPLMIFVVHQHLIMLRNGCTINNIANKISISMAIILLVYHSYANYIGNVCNS
ncbi:hypothetical protein OH491_12725 [Termitidicoccus mucosus]|uniref:Uncharacterized protein n=1 Tax=Termitidicoccus mucosus TaxID=1184151 RepID=A0A178IIV2_9BACT|nr:hypothetical protein AW736_14740 [Opitutaceae bacterium TSB47]